MKVILGWNILQLWILHIAMPADISAHQIFLAVCLTHHQALGIGKKQLKEREGFQYMQNLTDISKQ